MSKTLLSARLLSHLLWANVLFHGYTIAFQYSGCHKLLSNQLPERKNTNVLKTSHSDASDFTWDSFSKQTGKFVSATILAWSLASGTTSALPQRPPESNAQIILLESLPSSSSAAKELGTILGKITTEGSGNIRSVDSKGQKGLKPWADVAKAQKASEAYLSNKAEAIINSVQPKYKEEATQLIAEIKSDLADLNAALAKENKDKAVQAQVNALDRINYLGTMLAKSSFEAEPDDEILAPKFSGRAVVEMKVNVAKTKKTEGTKTMKILVDGVNAPYSSGNFLELVSLGFYDGLPITFVDESTVLTGDPPGKPVGYEKDGKLRTIPIELRAEGDKSISYGETLEEQGRFTAKPVLPFSAYGALAMAHPADNPNGGSSQIFFLKFDPIYTPAGLNTLDGNYAVFGYVTQGSAALDDLAEMDTIQSAKVLKTIEL
mmetsp:Transcript_37378/g.49241  ORF Transcript_37378/g.49241 Transcript_37378/m.49241 type:complete len:433 (+) Transcript_37378:120-1418(+)